MTFTEALVSKIELWRDVRAVEGATLEKSCSSRNRGFESHSLRQTRMPTRFCGFSLFFFITPSSMQIARNFLLPIFFRHNAEHFFYRVGTGQFTGTVDV